MPNYFKCKTCKANWFIVQPEVERLLGIKPTIPVYCDKCLPKQDNFYTNEYGILIDKRGE